MTKPQSCECDKECPCEKRVEEALRRAIEAMPQHCAVVHYPYQPCTRPHADHYYWWWGTQPFRVTNGTLGYVPPTSTSVVTV